MFVETVFSVSSGIDDHEAAGALRVGACPLLAKRPTLCHPRGYERPSSQRHHDATPWPWTSASQWLRCSPLSPAPSWTWSERLSSEASLPAAGQLLLRGWLESLYPLQLSEFLEFSGSLSEPWFAAVAFQALCPFSPRGFQVVVLWPEPGSAP